MYSDFILNFKENQQIQDKKNEQEEKKSFADNLKQQQLFWSKDDDVDRNEFRFII